MFPFTLRKNTVLFIYRDIYESHGMKSFSQSRPQDPQAYIFSHTECHHGSTPTPTQATPTVLAAPAPYRARACFTVRSANSLKEHSAGMAGSLSVLYQIWPALSQAKPPRPVAAR